MFNHYNDICKKNRDKKIDDITQFADLAKSVVENNSISNIQECFEYNTDIYTKNRQIIVMYSWKDEYWLVETIWCISLIQSLYHL